MESNWAADDLRVIRTLMERSAIYRRALAPLMLLAGSLGILAAVIGWFARIESPRAFVGFWLAVAVLTIAGCFLLLRPRLCGRPSRFGRRRLRACCKRCYRRWRPG